VTQVLEHLSGKHEPEFKCQYHQKTNTVNIKGNKPCFSHTVKYRHILTMVQFHYLRKYEPFLCCRKQRNH
jgi:hypothetical protein